MADNTPPSAASRPYLKGHAVGEHAVTASYSARAFYRWPAARRSNHDHGRMPFICVRYDHSHMRHLVGSEARLRGEVPPRHIRFYVQEPATVAQTFEGDCGAASNYVKSLATEIGKSGQEPIAFAGGQGVNSVPQPPYGSTTAPHRKGLCQC